MSPVYFATSGDANPLTNDKPSKGKTEPPVEYAVSTFPSIKEVWPTITFAASDTNALTTPLSMCNSGLWKYFRVPEEGV